MQRLRCINLVSPIFQQHRTTFSRSKLQDFIKVNHGYKRNYSSDSVNIFNREAKRIQRDRVANFSDSRDFDFLKEEVAYRLSDRLEVIRDLFGDPSC